MPAGKPSSGIGGMAQLAKLLDRAGVGGRGRRSLLTRWLRAHHDSFAAMLAEREPSWDAIAAALAEMGVQDGHGQPPTAERVRRVWWGVKRAKAEREKARARPAPPSLLPGEIAPGVLALPANGIGAGARPRLQLDIRPATPLADMAPDLTPSTSSSAPLAAPPTRGDIAAAPPAFAADADADAQVERLMDRMNANRVPLPKIVT